MTKSLVIVESPSKAKTIQKYLGQGYTVLASGGHVCDLPQKTLGIDVEHGFEPEYEINPEKKETIRRLKSALKQNDVVYLATDPDREGEAISWHLKNCLEIPDGKNRIVFNEISKKAVNNAIENPRELDMNLVNSPNGEMWKIEDHLFSLIRETKEVLSDNPLFYLLNSYTTGLQPTVMANMLKLGLNTSKNAVITADEIGLNTREEGIVLPAGASALAIF